MALASNEKRDDALVIDKTTGAVVTTTDASSAKPDNGVLVDPDGRLVVKEG